MTLGKRLMSTLLGVDWKKNIKETADDSEMPRRMAEGLRRVAVWSKQLENADKGNVALTFVRALQVEAQFCTALIPLALYRPAAASMRAMVESTLYYTYFRSHPVELATLARAPGFFLDKSEILSFHRTHTPNFNEKQETLGLLARLTPWYGKVSSIVHGQIPGAWVSHSSLSKVAFSAETSADAVATFEEGEDLVHRFLLSTVGLGVWYGFSSSSKVALLKGLKPATKTILGLGLT